METIIRKVKGRSMAFEIYTESEAKEKGITYKYWKECDLGDYGLSDDGFVGFCLGRKVYPHVSGKPKVLIHMSYGRAWSYGKAKLLFEARKATNSYSQTSAATWAETEANKTRTKQVVELAARQYIKDGKIDYDGLGKIYRSDQVSPGATLKRLFKSERISRMLDERVKELLKSAEVDEGTVIERVNDIYELAKGKEDLSNMNRSTEHLSDIFQMRRGVRQKETIQIEEAHSTSSVDGELEIEEKRMLKLTKETDSGQPGLLEQVVSKKGTAADAQA